MSNRILAFMILHQGRPYLRAAVESILPQVDNLIIFYSPKPSQGFQTDVPCPDTEEELKAECLVAYLSAGIQPADHLLWVRGHWSNESDHINAVQPYTEDYDWLVRLDADEIFPPGMVAEMISQAEESNRRAYRVPFVHFWRSFSRVCRDGSHPFRLFRVNGGEGERTLDSKGEKWEVLHFGYGMPTRYTEYKMQVSGHRPEWRPDWFKDRWLANAQADVHPVCYPTHWIPVDYDKEKLPDVLKRHPYFNAEVID